MNARLSGVCGADFPQHWACNRFECDCDCHTHPDDFVTEIYVAERTLACGCVMEPVHKPCQAHL